MHLRRLNLLILGAILVASCTALPANRRPSARTQSAVMNRGGAAAAAPAAPAGLDGGLLAWIAVWYAQNYFYNIANKRALKASGGAEGFPMTLATAQLAVGAVYGLYLWLAPDARERPKLSVHDFIRMVPVAICVAGAHAGSVFAMSAGSVSFGQIVKAAEPAFAAVVGTLLYNKTNSLAKWLTLLPIIGGVVLASVSELDFSFLALFAACSANTFAAFRGNENKKLMETPGLRDRIGSVGNQYAISTIMALIISIPVMVLKEGHKWGEFTEVFANDAVVRNNCLVAGLLFYLYNEVSTGVVKKTGAVTQSVANTAKRVIVILGVAIALREPLSVPKIIGSVICIGGVLLYSNADNLFPPKAKAN